MSAYHKIDTLFHRDPRTFVVDPTRLKSEVLNTISLWDVDEKIDGMNMRVMLSEAGEVTFGGRSDAAVIPGDLLQYMTRTFTAEKLKRVLWLEGAPKPVVLYGEGYGAGIQKIGKQYRPDKAFILFDVRVGFNWWVERPEVVKIAAELGIEVVPYLGRWSMAKIVDYVREPFMSVIGHAEAEGIVARPIMPLFDRWGRIIIKLKTRDFQEGKR